MARTDYELLLTKDEAVAAFWYLLKSLGREQRARFKEHLMNNPHIPCVGERALLVKAIIQYERDEAAVRDGSAITKIVGH